MRTTFIKTLMKLAQKDKNIYLLNGDLGFSVLEEFEKKFPKRYINCGVAEQNMMGVAAGLAMEGKKVYVYSIIPFVTFRCFEQIRNDICYHNLDIKIIGTGTGMVYGILGPTHFGIEDISVLRVLPNMTILSPSDPTEMEQLMEQSCKTKGPAYIRLDKSDRDLHILEKKVVLGKPSVIKKGKDGVVISAGSYAGTAMNAASKLEEQGLNLKVISLHTLKPVDEKSLLKEIKGYKNIFTAEEHRLMGGLGSIVAEILLKNGVKNVNLNTIGIEDIYSPVVGKQDYMRKYYKVDQDAVAKKILDSLTDRKV